MSSYDVVIIGAGVHGASAAYHLAGSGASVALLERNAPASGPTGRSSAICRAYYTNEFLAVVARESLDFLGNFAELTGGHDAGLRICGEMYLHPESDRDEVQQTVARLNAIGTACEMLDPAAVGERLAGWVPDGVACAAWEPGAGYADPAGTTSGLVAAAADRGATFFPHREVTELEASSGAVTMLAGGERFVGAKVLIAGGPWTGRLAARLGVSLPLSVERHIVATYDWGGADRIEFVLADVPHGYYLKPEGEEQFFLGSLWEEPNVDPDGFPEEISDEESTGLIDRVIRRVPSVAEAGTRGGWASLYDVSPDWQPVIGEVCEGVFVDCGTSGHGFKLAPALGRHVADLVLGRPVPALAQFSPERFGQGKELTSNYESARIIG